MRKLWKGLVAVSILVMSVNGAMAQRAIDGAQPHPLVPQPADSYITRDEFVDFASLVFPSGAEEGQEYSETLVVEGAHRQIEYTIDGTETAMPDRAASVASWLVERHGIPPHRLHPAGAGPMSPVTTNRTEDGRVQNRRVELVEVVR